MLHTIGSIFHTVFYSLPYILAFVAFVVLAIDNLRQRANKMHNYNTCIELNNEAQDYYDSLLACEKEIRDLKYTLSDLQDRLGSLVRSRYSRDTGRKTYRKTR